MESSLHIVFRPVFLLIISSMAMMSLHVVPSFCNCYFTSFVFGDSLVDSGNNNFLFTLSKANSPPYGIDFKPSGGQPTGRFTNGRTIDDIVELKVAKKMLKEVQKPFNACEQGRPGQALGAKSFPPPYLSPNSQTQVILNLRGINYASGASGILDQTGSYFIGRIPLREQVKYFEQNRKYMVNAMGENRTREFLKKAIFSLTIGSNDILNYVQPPSPFQGHDKPFPTTTTMFLDSMISNLTIQLERLHELGARKLIVVGVGPLGCIPFLRAFNLLDGGECLGEVNALIRSYNQRLKMLLNRLNQEMGPEAIFVFANSYDIFMNIIANHRQYGFENAHEACCGGYFPPFLCFKSGNANTSTSGSELCNDRSKYVFWDAFHPTEAANVIVARELLDGDESSSSPINIRKLYNYSNNS